MRSDRPTETAAVRRGWVPAKHGRPRNEGPNGQHSLCIRRSRDPSGAQGWASGAGRNSNASATCPELARLRSSGRGVTGMAQKLVLATGSGEHCRHWCERHRSERDRAEHTTSLPHRLELTNAAQLERGNLQG